MSALVRATRLDHVGLAAAGPETPLSAALGAHAFVGSSMPSGVAVARFGPADALELVWPAWPGTPIDSFLTRHGPGLHHVALQIDEDLVALRASLEAAGLAVIGAGIERSSDGRQCLFLHPRTTGGVLVELVEGARPGA
jgi:methylmalonyl-CoA/ethylmalonyl-CoA epimerase